MPQETWRKKVALFIGSQALSIFGSSLVQFAITMHITLSTNSGISAMAIILCSFLPALVLSPFAGVWADRYNKKVLIALSDGFIALSTLIVAFLLISGFQPPWIFYVVSAVRSLGSAVQGPSVSALLPEIVPLDQLTRINGIHGSIQSLITLGSPMLATALLQVTDIGQIFFIDVITAIIAIVILLLFLRIPMDDQKKEAVGTSDHLKELKDGLSYVSNHRYLLSLFVFVALFAFLASPVAFLTPLQVNRTYGSGIWQSGTAELGLTAAQLAEIAKDKWRLSAIEVAFSAGMLAGGILISIWGGFKNRIHTVAITAAGMGVSIIVMGFSPHFVLYFAMMAICGFFMPLFNTPAIIVLQERVDPNYMGRVFSVMAMINMTVMPVGMMIFGPLADVIPIEWLLIATGIGMIGIAVALYNNKPLLQVGEPLLVAGLEPKLTDC